jgi:hypothetical protein
MARAERKQPKLAIVLPREDRVRNSRYTGDPTCRRDPDDNPLAIVSLENYAFLTRRHLAKKAHVFGGS